jgi:hypothetical protein
MTTDTLATSAAPRRRITRTRAALIHLSISLLIGIVCMAVLFGVWYPPPYFSAAGADTLTLLVIGVDIVLGPLLTLIVFKPGKKGLRFDMAVIAALQLGALIYGMHACAASRPIFLVAAVDRFELVSANEITDVDLAAGSEPDFRERSWNGPRLAFVEIPTDLDEYSHAQDLALAGLDMQNVPRYFRPYPPNGVHMLERARSLAALYEKNPDARAVAEAWLRAHARDAASVVWVPLVAKRKDIIMLLDSKNGGVIAPLDIEAVW